MASSKLVYSTSGTNVCPHCAKPLKNCQCEDRPTAAPSGDGVVRIRREKKGRGGKEVTVISGLDLPRDELKSMAKQRKTLCGTGGSLKADDIELQGDKVDRAMQFLQQQGFTVKRSGG